MSYLLLFLSAGVATGGLWIADPATRRRAELTLLALFAALPLWVLSKAFFIGLATWFDPAPHRRYDLYVEALDRLMGNPAFAVGRWAALHPFWQAVSVWIYGALVPMMALVAIAWIWARPGQAWLPIRAFVLDLLLAPLVYRLVRVSGPRFAFPSFPAAPAPFAAHVVCFAAAPNGIPSVHNAIAMLCAVYLWPSKAGRVVGVALVALTVFATLALGEHYFTDILATVPYVALIAWLAKFAPSTPP